MLKHPKNKWMKYIFKYWLKTKCPIAEKLLKKLLLAKVKKEELKKLKKELYKKGFVTNSLKNKMKDNVVVGYRRVKVFEIEEPDLLEVFKKALKEESNIGGNGGASGKGGTGAIGGRDMEARGKDGNAR